MAELFDIIKKLCLADGTSGNRLRLWDKDEFKPRPDDIFQERLYCIQWITAESLNESRQQTYFAAPTEADLERERQVESVVDNELRRWQDERPPIGERRLRDRHGNPVNRRVRQGLCEPDRGGQRHGAAADDGDPAGKVSAVHAAVPATIDASATAG